ncbi:site-specific DNA-methyltransferase [Enterococcus nangangensis]
MDTDGKIDLDKLKYILADKIEEAPERYNFTWNGKKQAMKLAQQPSKATLKPNKEKSKNWDTTENLYIEGDNLEVLKLLQKSYSNKVKLIYVDPPYNTGKDFVYKDNFKDSIENYLEQTGQVDRDGNKLSVNTDTSGRYHTDWLNMMYPRLKLARNLLTEDGVIFLSIDDNELQNLLKMLDEVFGPNNFVGIISVENNPKGRKNSSFISVSSEYLVVYSKNKDKSYFIENVPKNASDMKLDENGRYVHNSGKRVLVGDNSFNDVVTNVNSKKNYSVYYQSEQDEVIIKRESKIEDSDYNLESQGYKRYFSSNQGNLVLNTYTKEKFMELFSNKALEFSDDKIFEKNFNDTIRIKSQLVNKKYEAIVNGRKENFNFDLTTTGAGTHLKNLFQISVSPFSAPKNVGLLRSIITLIDEKDCIVLDFFSGSSTTAEAVMTQNSIDLGNRRFIMIQLPENLEENLKTADNDAKKTIQAAIKYLAGIEKNRTLPAIAEKRIDLAGDKIATENPLLADQLDIGFKVFELDKSNVKKWNLETENIVEQLDFIENNFEPNSTSLDVVYEIMLKQGLDLACSVVEHQVGSSTIYDIAYGAMLVVLGDAIESKVAEFIINKIKEEDAENSVVVFQDNKFVDDSEKLNTIEALNANGIQYDDILSI